MSGTSNPRELVARVRAVPRRADAPPNTWRPPEFSGLRLDPDRREASAGSRMLKLRAKQLDLLHALAANPGLVLSREQSLSQVSGYDYYGVTRTVDVHTGRLRSKLAGTGVAMETVWGSATSSCRRSGAPYRLRWPAAPASAPRAPALEGDKLERASTPA